MLANIGLLSFGAALTAYTLMTAWLLLTKTVQMPGRPVLIACLATVAWAGVTVHSAQAAYPHVKLMQLTELARDAAWIFFLLKLLGKRLLGSDHILASSRWTPHFMAGFMVLAVAIFGPQLLGENLPIAQGTPQDIAFVAWLAMSIFALFLVEQIYRNSTEAERWSIKYLCLGLGLLFSYDFFMYAEALLFRTLNPDLWQGRGIASAFAAVFITLGLVRANRSDSTRSLHVSRHVVFHSVTLLAAGIYLIMMALVGYFIRYWGGTWGGVLQITFLSASGLLLLALLFSGQVRAKTQVWLSKNFFSYKYDYRTEWLQFTQILAKGDSNIPQNITRAIAYLSKSPAGILWSRSEGGRFDFTENWEMPRPPADADLSKLARWVEEREWIIDLQEWRQAPDFYEGLEMPTFLDSIPRAWLIIPLMLGEQLQGILLLSESDLQPQLNWEDRDLLKVAGRQAASHLAQYQANQSLVESRQFEAFNRLSAYVIHDLKNILAQQSLIVSNAEKHRDNPAFIDDMIDTVKNSVDRMTRLMEQMRSGTRGKSKQIVEVLPLLEEAISRSRGRLPEPTLQACPVGVKVDADREHLATVFAHIIQNAQDATPKTGEVTVVILPEKDRTVIKIQDTGCGMDEDFLRNRLFKPFDSTKGLTGMGVGAFESREFVRDLGGDIDVSSSLGGGSVFRIILPRASDGNRSNLMEKESTIE